MTPLRLESEYQTTDWYLEGLPERHGVYQVSLTRDEIGEKDPVVCYQHWNGEFWGLSTSTAEEAEQNADVRSAFQNPAWRGIAAPP
jgi:hypothetical protein